MPYITKIKRESIQNGNPIFSAGELNYVFTKAIIDYIGQDKLSYQLINDVLGALEGAKLEFYRRVVVPYEQKKLEENGDVY